VKTKLFRFSGSLAFVFSFFLLACNPNREPAPQGQYANGFFVVNEGPFRNGTGSINYYSRQSNSVTENIFELENNRPLGNIVQSMTIHGEKAYIVVNNANKVEVVDAGSFQSTGVIEGLTMPRYFTGINETKAYVSQWGDNGIEGSIKVVNLNNLTISKTIPTGKGAERMIQVGQRVYVVNTGGYVSDNKVSIINTSTDEVEKTTEVDFKPNSIQADASGNIWVMCGGKKVYNADWSINEDESTEGALLKLSPTGNILQRLPFASKSASPSKLVINAAGNTLYYTYQGGVYAHPVSSNQLNTTPIIIKSFYGIGVDPETGYLFGSDAKDFASNGEVLVYDLSNGELHHTLPAGIAPNSFVFRK
jgi:hypothetical protein